MRILMPFALAALAGLVAAQTTIYVDASTGNDSNDGLTPSMAVKTVTQGIDLVGGNGTVNIEAGTYSNTAGESFPKSFSGTVSLVGVDQATVILDGLGDQILSASGTSLSLEEITFQDGDDAFGGCVRASDLDSLDITSCTFRDSTASFGGGLFISNNSSGTDATLTDCTFDNISGSFGGGLDHNVNAVGVDASLTLDGCLFTNNSTSFGNSAFMNFNGASTGTLTVVDCEFSDNGGGGALMLNQNDAAAVDVNVDRCLFANNGSQGLRINQNDAGASASVLVTNSIFDNNSEAIRLDDDAITFIVNCTIINNSTGVNSVNTAAYLSNSILWDNSTEVTGAGSLSYSILQGLAFGSFTDGSNNLGSDPLLDANAHLTAGSPAIDSGVDSSASSLPFDIDGETRIYDDPGTANGSAGTVDRGADEFGSSTPGGGPGPAMPGTSILARSLLLLALCAGLAALARRPL